MPNEKVKWLLINFTAALNPLRCFCPGCVYIKAPSGLTAII